MSFFSKRSYFHDSVPLSVRLTACGWDSKFCRELPARSMIFVEPNIDP